LFRDIRQPDWWQGDDEYHPPPLIDPASSLQAKLEEGNFVITAEVSPPAGVNPKSIISKANRLSDKVHAVNITQNPMAMPRTSSLACSLLLARFGIEPVLQLTARDYNRFALQAEALGASTLGIHNILCLTGDPPTSGNKPAGGLPFDLDATQMLWILRRMRDEKRFLDGREMTEPPKIYLGAAGSPNDPNLLHESIRLEKKVNAGAQFIQTQLVYDVDVLSQWLEALDKRNLLGKVHILVGIGPIRSAKVAHYILDHIPDVQIPDQFVDALEKSTNPEETGFQFTVELANRMKTIPGVAGIHIMSMRWEKVIPRLLGEMGAEL
jgi:methylenetetrahydrofolate reductase (NADPH)